MVLLELDNELTDVLPGITLPAGAASFVFARIQWIQAGEMDVFDMEAPPPWDFFDLCTLAFLVANHEASSAKLMISNLLQPCPPSHKLPSTTLVNQNDNYLKKCQFRRRRKRTQRRRFASSGHENDARLQVRMIFA